MNVKQKIEKQTYEKLLKYVFQKCDVVSFVTRTDKIKLNFDAKEKLKILEQNLFEKYHKYFIGNKEEDWVKENNSVFNVYYITHFYRLGNELKEYLLSNKNLYNWLEPKYPEDICFYKNGYCWLYSVTHEEICDIYCENEEEYEYLKSIGIEFVEDKFVPTPKEELYYEEY